MKVRQLRLHVAVNRFKQMLLDDFHVPGKPQTSAVFDVLYSISEKLMLTEPTWQSWFADVPVLIKTGKAEELDELAEKVISKRCNDGSKKSLPKNYFKNLIYGGIADRMLPPTKSKHVREVLVNRAQGYTPISQLHLHIDAIEINALTNDFCGIAWSEVTRIAALRIFDLLFNRWGPRHGQIFSSLSSSLKLRWEAADADERNKILDSYASVSPNLFDYDFDAGAVPNWHRTGVDRSAAPQHIHKILFALAADPDFLVADRLEAWVIDLATAALTMRAFERTDLSTFLGAQVTDEMHFWNAFNHIFFDPEADKIDDWYLSPAMQCCFTEWDERSLTVFESARKIYQDMVADLGISTHII